jgi:proteasome accessory factor B
MTVHKAERLVNLIALLLDTSRPLTGRQINEIVPGYGHESKDSFKRMFERDKQELREVGIPIEMAAADVWDTEEGYRIPKDRYYLPDLDLGKDELTALWVAAGLLRTADQRSVRSALIKLGGDLPPLAPPAPRSLPWLSADLNLDSPVLPKAFEAIADRKTVTFQYTSRSGARQRTVDPYSLVHRKGAWYVIGRDHESGEVRSFRHDRIDGEVHIDDPSKPGPDFDVPSDFRAEDHLEAPPFVGGEGGAVEVRVRFGASAAWWVERGAPWLRMERNPDGSAEADIRVADIEGFVSWCLWYGEGVEVVSPPEVRARMRERLEEICDG